jgi:hypothetical protein
MTGFEFTNSNSNKPKQCDNHQPLKRKIKYLDAGILDLDLSI